MRETLDALRDHRRAVMRFWESRRLVFLALLAVVTGLAYVWFSAPRHLLLQFPSPFGFAGLLFYFIGANACYSLVYVVEFLLMGTRWHAVYIRHRWMMFVGGCLWGMILTYPLAWNLFRWTM